MKRVKIEEATTRLSKLIDEAMAGETVVLEKEGIPMVKLVPCHIEQEKRPMGGLESKIWISDDFDDEDARVNHLFKQDCVQ